MCTCNLYRKICHFYYMPFLYKYLEIHTIQHKGTNLDYSESNIKVSHAEQSGFWNKSGCTHFLSIWNFPESTMFTVQWINISHKTVNMNTISLFIWTGLNWSNKHWYKSRLVTCTGLSD